MKKARKHAEEMQRLSGEAEKAEMRRQAVHDSAIAAEKRAAFAKKKHSETLVALKKAKSEVKALQK